jgi:hypothetical protein
VSVVGSGTGEATVQPRDPVASAFVYGLGVAVALAWLASVCASILDHTYVTPIALHGLMGTVVGSVFADVGLRRAQRKIAETRLREDD